ncbi:MAG: sigma-70 family RNA polymerase sigma factor, partial [Nitrospinae bacterium]|nr:sigma-70 family RNA polymerase sigma factor [Nitrospinota bacterium]
PETQAIVPVPPKNKKALVPLSKATGIKKLDVFESYISRIRNIRHLEEDEEYELTVKYKEENDEVAAYKVVSSHLMLVVKIAYSFNYAFNNVMDLIQEGNIGLMEALKKFDPYRGVRFSAYASWWIRAYIIKYLMDNWRLVKVGTTNTRRKLLYNLKKEREKLEAQGIEPHTKLLAERLNVTEKDVIEIGEVIDSPDVSLDAPIGDDSGGATTIEIIADTRQDYASDIETNMLRKFISERIMEIRETLSTKELFILDNRLLSETPLTLQVIGDKYGVTKEAIRLSEASLLKKLKKIFSKHGDLKGL